MSRRPRYLVLLTLGLLVLAVAASGCASLAKPKGFASPVVTDEGVLLVPSGDDIYAYDVDTLGPLWRFPSGDIKHKDVVALYGTPAVAGGTVFVPTYDGKLYALDLKDGTPIWPEAFKAGGPLVGGVAVANGTAFFGSSEGDLYAVDAESGEQVWPKFTTDKEVWSTPVVIGADLYVTSLDGSLYVLDPATGQLRWSYDTDAGVAAPPVVDTATGRVFVGSFDQKLHGVDIASHQEVWTVKADNWFWSRPLLEGANVYAASLDGRLYAAAASDGASIWSKPFEAKTEIKASPILIGGTIFVADRDGFVFGVDPATGQAKFPEPLKLANGVLADPVELEQGGSAVLALVTTRGTLYFIDPQTLQVLRQIELSG